MNQYFTSDTHFSHQNIILYTHRPYSSVKEMNEAMIENWNKVVKPEDDIYHTGDFAFCPPEDACRILKSLNGHKYLIEGNHDRKNLRDRNFRDCFEWIDKLAGIEIHKQNIVLCHYAMRVWDQSHRNSWCLFGHSHNSLPDDPTSLSMDIGVDANNFTPISFDQIKEIMDKKMNSDAFKNKTVGLKNGRKQ